MPSAHAVRLCGLALTLIPIGSGISCSHSQAGPPASSSSPSSAELTDRPLETWRASLLELAFDAASAFPLNPHVKNRSRAQASVAEASLDLGQARRAAGFAERIADWNRGAVWADLACYVLQSGLSLDARPLAERARAVASGTCEPPLVQPITQDWQRDRIRSKLAIVLRLSGDEQAALEIEAGLAESELGPTFLARAAGLAEHEVHQFLRAMAPALDQGSFDQARHALQALVQVHGRFYADTEIRNAIEMRVAAVAAKLPPQVQVELVERLGLQAARQGDLCHAAEFAAQLRDLTDRFEWSPQDRLPILARAAALRGLSKERPAALLDLEGALAQFELVRHTIVDIYRAGVLRSLAVAFDQLGERGRARELYQRAIEAGLENPNARPRAEDFVATCLALVQGDLEPDGALNEALRKARERLVAPW